MDTHNQDEVSGSAVPQAIQDKEHERKQRNREYRVAARREKRNRKADEKKQRKLNATILRRMTRNPDKYNKNAERNRLRDVDAERRRIWHQAVQQAQRLAAVYDPSGVTFHVSPVVKQEDGTIISQDSLKRRQDRIAERSGAGKVKAEETVNGNLGSVRAEEIQASAFTASQNAPVILKNGFNPERLAHVEAADAQLSARHISKKQLKRRVALEPRPPPPKPVIPQDVKIPEGEENWLALWDLSDEQLERRIIREKKRKAAERKALRVKQKSGKAERRIARDEKRRIYREIKLEWKAIKEETTRQKTKLKGIEDEESKRISVETNNAERKAALEICSALGFTVANTPGIEDIKPRALGMKGVEVDFDAIEIGGSRSDVKQKKANKRVDLGAAPGDSKAEYVPTGQRGDERHADEFIKLDVGDGQDFETINYNHKLRRKLRRAIDNAEIRKETLVRQRALDHYKEMGIEAPTELRTPHKPLNVKGHRILENGMLETAKQERVRARMELAEFNAQMRILRRQAKEAAVYAGLKRHAELIGKIPLSSTPVKEEVKQEAGKDAESSGATSEVERSFKAAEIQGDTGVSGTKRSRAEYEASTSMDAEGQNQETSETTSSSEESSNSAFPDPPTVNPHSKKQARMEIEEIPGSDVQQSWSINHERQAMINAEAARTASSGVRDNRHLPNGSSPLKEVGAKAARVGEKGGSQSTFRTSNWNVNSLAGDKARKSKFLRLLGGVKSGIETNKMDEKNTSHTAVKSDQVSAELERQYEDSLAYKQSSKRKGLGA